MLIAASEEQIKAAHGSGGQARWGHDFKMIMTHMVKKQVLKMN